MEYKDPFSKESREIAVMLDKATDSRDSKAIIELIKKAEVLEKSQDSFNRAQLSYSIGTAYGDLSVVDDYYGQEECLEKQIFYFRYSIDTIENEVELEECFLPYVNGLKQVLFTNAGSCLDACGRKIAAIQMYFKALEINNKFGMVIGNLGMTYRHYALLVSDFGHRDYLNYFAYHNLKYAMKSNDVHKEAKEYFSQALDLYDVDYINKVLEPDLNIPQFRYDGKEEKYRRWCLNNHLFLNPLNDLNICEEYFAADVIQLPNMVLRIDDKPVCYGMFNQLKQEYVYARFLFYEVYNCNDNIHFADKETYLVNFADYPQYSIRIEKLKTAYRILYSLLDKAAYFLNRYFELGIDERDVSFRSIWHSEKTGRNGYKYKNILKPEENYAIRALYWIRKDFYECIHTAIQPKAKFFCDLRNALEHKYVKVFAEWASDRSNGEIDDLAFYISEDRLVDAVLKMLRIMREVIMNISFAVKIEENKRYNGLENMPKIYLDIYDDEWKI